MTVQAIIDIDVCNIYTGEIVEKFNNVWLGSYDTIYNGVASKYVINKTERDGDRRTIWVEA